jgi:hypothetical protein
VANAVPLLLRLASSRSKLILLPVVIRTPTADERLHEANTLLAAPMTGVLDGVLHSSTLSRLASSVPDAARLMMSRAMAGSTTGSGWFFEDLWTL